ncbi:MAG: DNA-processing protein DprA [Candidatus Poribacteria bacterium]|nr:DNA-processing protein DprA [Candidatus Poribacteria bacterium]
MKVETPYFWFRLFKTHGIGTKSLALIAEELKNHQLQPEKLSLNSRKLSAQCPELAKIINGKIRAEDSERIYDEYQTLKRAEITILHPSRPDFPRHLFEISPILFLKGQRKLLASDGVAIVGARNVSDMGIQVAKEIAAGLAREGMNVVSGYAKGVDSTAHLAALEADGTTTLVLPYGINELRKKREFKKYNWKQDVLAVSQFSPDAKWLARNAMIRNKLICALSKAVVVIESGPERDAKGKMSGTFDTGKTALEMKLPLFVVDPKYYDDSSKGNADLIALDGRKIDPFNGIRDIVSYFEKTKSKKPCDTTINANDVTYVQTDFLTDPQVSTESNTTA